jgi:hypothetical protein
VYLPPLISLLLLERLLLSVSEGVRGRERERERKRESESESESETERDEAFLCVPNRVTRLGQFSPKLNYLSGRWFTLGICFKMTEGALILWATFFHGKSIALVPWFQIKFGKEGGGGFIRRLSLYN